MPDGKKLITDWIHVESVAEGLHVHRGRADAHNNGYTFIGTQANRIEYTLPVLVETSADDDILQKYIYHNNPYWRPLDVNGDETSEDSEELRNHVWQIIMPFIDVKKVKPVPKIEKIDEDDKFKDRSRKAMNRAQIQGQYTDTDRKKKIRVIGSNECYTFYQSVEFVVDWFLKNVDKNYFKNKVVYCNCDDVKSAFWIYFYNNFHKLGLKMLIASSFDGTGLSYGNDSQENLRNLFSNFDYQGRLLKDREYKGYIFKYDGKTIHRVPPKNEKSTFHGDFRDEECYEIAKNEADIIMTNPPFGQLWRQYVECMLLTGKKLIFWGNGVSVTYNWLQQLLDEKKVFVARECSDHFLTDHYMSPVYHRKKVTSYIYTTEDLSFQKPDKKCYSKKKKMLKEGTAWYDDNKILICDNATIPIDTDEVLAVSVYIIRYGILNDGYEILKNYQRYAPIKDGKEKFARILIQKIKSE
ncbi:MAG: hypothetical protein IJ590_00985 [Rickettsiales bacterium]|nr:hypothetical protein [Rickettsiales bacterium]